MTSKSETQVGGRIVRPYAMTGGRTGAGLPMIALEALVAVTPAGMRMRGRFRWEAAEIIAMSRRETALIELAAMLDVPIGVVRVLVADLRGMGAVTITDPPPESVTETDELAHIDLLEKVLDGIKSL
ncbi:MAG: DUF742 domain-containing protein [Acidimicrobiia bacterium]